MEKKISNAFSFMFQDPDWKYKYGVLALLSVPAGYYNLSGPSNGGSIPPIWLILLVIVVSFFTAGYGVQCTNNVIFANDENQTLLPAWEDGFGHFFGLGFRKMIATILMIIVLIIPSIIVIPLLIFLFISLALERNFCTEYKFSGYLQWGKAFKLIGQNPGKYITIALAIFGLSIVMGILLAIVVLTTMATMPIVALVGYSILIPYFLLAQAYLVGIIGEDNAAIYEQD